MPTEFTVVGEHRDDPTEFLVVGADGTTYAYLPDQERFVPVEPGEDWVVFAGAETLEDVAPATDGAEP